MIRDAAYESPPSIVGILAFAHLLTVGGGHFSARQSFRQSTDSFQAALGRC